MKSLKIAIIFCLFYVGITNTYAQHKLHKENPDEDSIHLLTEGLIRQELKQQEYDSLTKVKLQQAIDEAAGDKKKTHELEAKLNQIATVDSLRKANQRHKIEELKKNAKGFAVVPFNDTLFYVYAHIGSFSAAERAAAINQRIVKLYNDPFYYPDSLKLSESENSTVILYDNETQILSVTTNDALWLGKGQTELANEYLAAIKAEIANEKEANSVMNWVKKIGLVVLVAFGLGLLIYGINFLFKKLRSVLVAKKEKYITAVSIGTVKIVNEEQFQGLVFKALNMVRIVVIIVTVYLSLPLLFSIFPETKQWTNTLIVWVLTPAKLVFHAIINFMPNMVTILVIYFIFRYVLKGMKYFVNEIENGNITINGFHADWAKPTFNILKILLYAFMVVLVFPYLPGSSSTAFQGVSVFIGVLFSLGSSNAIANMIAGVVITYMRPFKIGDRIKIGDVVGDVIEKTMLVIRLRTQKNEEITIPNSSVLASNTINYSANATPENQGLIIHTTVTIGYDVPWKQMHETLINAALRTEFVLKTPEPFVLQTSLEDFYVAYQINAYTKHASKQAHIYSLLHQNIQDCCNEAGIEIMSPHYRAERDGNQTTIPVNYTDGK